jgi:hypothetical protein
VLEHRRKNLLTHVIRRFILHFAVTLVLALASIAIGMWGYEHYEHLPWRDAFVNTAMLLGGMGPVNAPQTDAGKVFEGIYALYAGLLFLIVAGVMFAPLIHWVLHRFHFEELDAGK